MQPSSPGEKPASVPIQSVTINQPRQPMLVGQPQAHSGQFVVNPTAKNTSADVALAFGCIGSALVAFGFVLPLFCFFAWFFGLIAIGTGHVGAGNAKTSGIGLSAARIGYLLGYITLAFYIAPIIVLFIILSTGGSFF